MQTQLSTDVRAALEEAAGTLGEALHLWWPTALRPGMTEDDELGHNEVPEATVRMHISAALAKRGLLVYAEVPFEVDGKDGRVDMLAIRGAGPNVELALIELKRFISGEKAGAMAEDWRRLQGARWPAGVEFPQLVDCAAVCRAIVGTTWYEEYASWWADGMVDAPEGSRQKRPFNSLRDAVRGATTFNVPVMESGGIEQVMVVALS